MPHAGAGQGEAEGALPLQARVAVSHSKRQRSGEPGPGAGGLKALVGDTSHPHRFGLLRIGNTWILLEDNLAGDPEAGALASNGQGPPPMRTL